MSIKKEARPEPLEALTVRLPRRLHAELARRAEEAERSLAAEARLALRRHVGEATKKTRPHGR